MDELRGLWHGKRVDNGEWVTGLLAYRDFELSSAQLYNEKDCEEFWVDPSTLGECTGVSDKNKRLIFEGDICQFQNYYHDNNVHCFLDDKGREWSRCEIVYRNGEFGGYVENEWFGLCTLTDPGRNLETIGNIYDNPELLNAAGKRIGNAEQDTLLPAT